MIEAQYEVLGKCVKRCARPGSGKDDRTPSSWSAYGFASEVLRALGRNDSATLLKTPARGLTLKKSSLPSAKPPKIKITHPTKDYFGQQCRIVSGVIGSDLSHQHISLKCV
jgi:hypothetical protein